MPVVLLIILLVLSSVIFYLSGYLHGNDGESNGLWIFSFLIALLVISGILDIKFGNGNQIRSDYMLQVEYDVDCKNNDCDTTFIYNRKNKLELTQPTQPQPVNDGFISSPKPIIPDTVINITNGVRDTSYFYHGGY